MDAIPPPTGSGSSSVMAFGHGPTRASNDRWPALHDAARMVAALAEIEPEPALKDISEFPARMRKATSWRRDLVEHGLEDIAAAIEPGLAALCRAESRGTDPRPAAQALWREFVDARSAVLALLPPDAAPDLLFGA